MKKRLPLIITCIVLAAAIIAAGIIFNPFKSDAGKHIEMGQRYLDELQWESALAEFELALEIEPRNIDARLGAAEAYIGLGQYADAVRILAEGYILTGDERLKAALSDERLSDALAEYLATIDDGRLAGLLSGEAGTSGDSGTSREMTSGDSEADGNNSASETSSIHIITLPQSDEQVIKWQDAALEASVRQYLGKPEGDIIYADVKDITELRIYGENIAIPGDDGYDIQSTSQIKDQYGNTSFQFSLRNGIEINERGNIVCIDDLAFFTSLKYLSIYSNNISDISPLGYLTQLEELELVYIPITDISPLCNLSALSYLNIMSTPLHDISPLAGLKNITKLTLTFCQIEDISALSELTNLINLALSTNNISDISPLANLTALTVLDIDSNSISDISPLSGLINVLRLNISHNKISDIMALENLTNLEILNIGGNKFNDISPLAKLTSLRVLYMRYAEVKDISPLANLSNLYCLDLSHTPVTDLSPLDGIEGLTIYQ